MRKKMQWIPALVLVMVSVLAGCSGNSKTERSAIAYNDSIVNIQEGIIRQFLDLGNKFETFDSAIIYIAYQNLQEVVDNSIEDISALGSFKNESYLRDAATDLFEFYKEVLNNEYKVILEVMTKGAEYITDYDTALLDSLAQVITIKEEKQDEKFSLAQEKFAKQFDVQIKENELQEEIDAINED